MERAETKYINCDKEGHLARDCTEPKKVLPDLVFHETYVYSHVMVPHSDPYWIVDSRVTEQVAKDRVELIEYRRISKQSRGLYVGNEAGVQVLRTGTY